MAPRPGLSPRRSCKPSGQVETSTDQPHAAIWLHESKLLEGIDDDHFVVVVLFEEFGNARQLVQQIGRVIRSSDPSRRERQLASVVARDEPMRARLAKAWARYLEFERHCANGVEHLVRSEAAMPERVLEKMPEVQYVDRHFRRRYLRDGPIAASGIQLPQRASVFLVDPHFDAQEAEHELEEAILATDRFRPQPIDGLPEGMFGRIYYAWRNSPYLVDDYFAEWILGICVAQKVGDLLFVQDTGGIVFDPAKLDVRRADREILLRAFPHRDTSDVVLTRMSALSLDMSDRSIRTQATRTRSFDATFTDLLDPSLVPTSVYGFVSSVGRYLGIAHARISDASEFYLPLPEFKQWVDGVAAELADRTRKPNRVFDRYAMPVTTPVEAAKPVSILLDLTSETFAEFGVLGEDSPGGLGHDLPYDDLCAEIDPDGKFHLVRTDGEAVECRIVYRPETGSYRIASPRLNELHQPKVSARSKRNVTLTQQINNEQAFRVLVGDTGIVYTRRGFYRTRDLVTADGTVLPLADAVTVPSLRNTVSEKGEEWFHEARWKQESVFGVIKAIADGETSPDDCPLAKALAPFDLLILDDGGDELDDFIAVGEGRVAFIHAKAATDLHTDGVTQLQAVGRQAVASLAFCSTLARVDGIARERWNRPYIANKTPLPLSRLFRDPHGGCIDIIDARVKAALRNPSFAKEVWVVAGRLLNIDQVVDQAKRRSLSNRGRQLLMFIESLRTACGRANARMRLFAHGHDPAA